MNDEIKPLNLDTEKTTSTAMPAKKKSVKIKITGLMVVLVILGALTGFGLTKLNKDGGGVVKNYKTSADEGVMVGDTFGVQDEKAFRDTVEGTLVIGGVAGEGSHHLTREGGASQNVYLTSSVIDLDQFVDKKVKVWGETFEGQKAGWLMDVGRLQIIE